GMLDDYFATLALENADQILARSQSITRGNLEILSEWVDQEPMITWVRPNSGTTALLKYDFEIPSRDFCLKLLEETGVLFTPGSALDMEGYLRIGYANNPEILRSGLKQVSEFLANLQSNF
ncbi:MAG: aspartate/methionine/tyrosine aminotransferase, partial [Gammaproteobacteria bacterium]